MSKVFIVTGASSGMGKETALYMAEKGTATAITLFARRAEALDAVAQEIASKFPSVKTLCVAGDASKVEDNEKVVAETVAKFGGLSGIFINAGAYRGGKMVHETEQDDIDALVDINMKGVLYALRFAVPAIKETVGEDGPTGSIVINSSCMGDAVIGPKSAGSGVYSASKAFVNSIVETTAIENAPRIRVNGVMPGVVQTGIMPVDDDTYQKIGAAMQPLWGRPGKAVEVASLVNYLLSNDASFISGTNIKADGLWSLSGGSFAG